MTPASKKSAFLDGMPKAEEFKKQWLSAYRDGAYNHLAAHFGISIPTVYQVRKLLGLPHLHTNEHPGRRAFRKRVRDLYHKSQSTRYVGRVVGMSSQRINQILREERVTIAPQYQKNVLLVEPKNGMTARRFNREVKHMHEEGMTNAQIAKTLRVDQGTVGKRVVAMGLTYRQHHRHVIVPGGYPCVWCGTVMERVWIASGARKQRFCSGPCKSKAKEYRRYLDAERKIKVFEQELRHYWGKRWTEQRAAIVQRQCNSGQHRKPLKPAVAPINEVAA